VLGDARIASILPSKGHHQGNTSVSIFGSGFLFNSSEIRCCWDHHPGYLSSQIIKDGRVKGGDGVPDKETVPTLVSDTLLVCPSYVSIPGYTHTDDLLLSFGHTSCNGSQLLDTELDFQFYLNTLDMQVRAVEPRGGPVAGGTRVRFVGTNFGGHRMRCRFGWYEVDATYIDINHVMCNSPHVRQPHSAEVQVARCGARATPPSSPRPLVPSDSSPHCVQIAADGETYTTYELMFTFYLTAGMVSSVWPLGGPTAGGTHITVRGAGFNNFDDLAIYLGSGPPLRTWLLSSTAMVATTSNASSAWLSPSSVSPVGGTPVILPFGDPTEDILMSDGRPTRPVGGYADGGMGPAAPGGETVFVTLNGDLRPGEALYGAAQFRYYDPNLLAVSEVFPLGAHHAGGEVITLHGSGFVNLGAPYCAFGNMRTGRGNTQPEREWQGGEGGSHETGDVPREKWGWFPHHVESVVLALPQIPPSLSPPPAAAQGWRGWLWVMLRILGEWPCRVQAVGKLRAGSGRQPRPKLNDCTTFYSQVSAKPWRS